ncbi:MAG: hypothetical protein KKH22_05850 [Proteobacteria bacterium]|nr:hypothetical protein [Pseudomonadota bacterium]
MADLLFSDVMDGAESLRAPLCHGVYARGMPEEYERLECEKPRMLFSHENRDLHTIKKIIYRVSYTMTALFIATERASNTPKTIPARIILRPEYPLGLQA